MRRITLEVPEELHRAIKKLAFVEDRSITSITREALEMFCVDRQLKEIKVVDERTEK
jgi:predicted transcriptional regulator